ncbi:hypothetical protein C4568_02770 [Candidatus Parcubacteria bacterium]|nr:MAG: hypothetical protein C4568_02770 [Candidatus Parcubacteria bacterium]
MKRYQIFAGLALGVFVVVLIAVSRPTEVEHLPQQRVMQVMQDSTQTDECSGTIEHPNPSLCPSGKIDEHLTIDNTYRNVTFCGYTFKSVQVIIDGVDVIQRLAELANTEKPSEGQDMSSTCFNIVFNNPERDSGAILDVSYAGGEYPSYGIQISATGYDIDLSDGNIYDFSFIGSRLLGSLR